MYNNNIALCQLCIMSTFTVDAFIFLKIHSYIYINKCVDE